jgi:outer membrane lipoprotein-sorting protein
VTGGTQARGSSPASVAKPDAPLRFAPSANFASMTCSKRSLALAAGAAALVLTAGATWADDDAEKRPATPSPTWYAQALARGAAGLNVTHFWSKGPMLRAETVVAGHKVVTIVRGEWYYAYDGLTLQGLAIRRDPAAIANDRVDRRPFGDEYRILTSQGAELVREETTLGRKTGVYRVTDDYGRRELWVTEDEDRMPLRIEVYERSSSRRRYTDYLNWQSGLFIPDAFFEPDPSAQLSRLTFDEYAKRSAEEGPVGPVPVLYTNLLHVKKTE